MEIDERAGALAAFALIMKARGKDRRFFRRVQDARLEPNICVLRPIAFDEGELSGETWIQEAGDAKDALLHDLHLFREADNFGSLLRPQLSAEQLETLRWRMQARLDEAQADWLEQGGGPRSRGRWSRRSTWRGRTTWWSPTRRIWAVGT